MLFGYPQAKIGFLFAELEHKWVANGSHEAGVNLV